MVRWLALGCVGIIVLGVVTWRLVTWGPSGSRHRARDSTDPAVSLETRIAALESRPARERVVFVERPFVGSAQSSDPETPASEPPGDPSKQASTEDRAAVAKLEARFRRESFDPAFAREAAAAAREGLESGGHSRVDSIECAKSMCKIVVTHDNLDEQTEVANRVQAVPFFAESTYYSYERDATPPRTTLYVARAGHNLRD
jgi:hypothetical protein